jgi:membrane protease YdiL (CAAX protease family)
LSIASADAQPEAITPILLIWIGVALLLFMGAGGLRLPGYLVRRRESVLLVPAMSVAAILTFVTWLLVQIVYGLTVRIIYESTGRTPGMADTVVANFVAPFVSAVVALLMIRRTDVPREIGLVDQHPAAALLPGTIMALIAIPMAQLTLLATSLVLEHFGVPHPDKHPLIQILSERPPVWVRAMIALSAVVMAPISEELLFRGLVQSAFRKATGMPWLAVLVASALFALVHPWWSMPAIFVLSLLIGILYERTRSLWAAIVIHALFNGYSLIAFTQG